MDNSLKKTAIKRRDIEYPVKQDVCRAWLYRPAQSDLAPQPCIVMAHGLGGTRDAGLEPYAYKFVDAGYVVLLFDYRHFGASDGEPRQFFSTERQLQDWAGAITFACGLPEVDPDRVALWGSSFSGGHVIVAAARNGNVAALVAQGPMMDGWGALLHYVSYAGIGPLLKLTRLAIVDQLRALLRMSPVLVPVVGRPGELAAMTSHDAYSGYMTIAPPGWRNELCPRFALTLGRYRPIAHAAKVACPALIQVCKQDSVAPAKAAIMTARRMGTLAELKQYDCGHFDIYTGRDFEQASNDQLVFFDSVLRPQT